MVWLEGVVARESREYGVKGQLENRICRQIQDLHANVWHKREKEAQRLFTKLRITLYSRGFKLSSFLLYHVCTGRSF